MTPEKTNEFTSSLKPQENNFTEWSIKTIKSPPKEIREVQLIIFGSVTALGTLNTWLTWSLPTRTFEAIFSFTTLYSIAFLFILIFRQKTVFNYKVAPEKASLEYYRYYPDFAAPFFKGIAIFTILLFVGIALFTGSLLFLIGPAAISLGAARFLLSWENQIHHQETRPWSEHNFVTIDRKRSIIVIHCTDINTGFEARFPNKELLEQYLQFLRTVLPPTTEYTEKAWEW